LKRETIRSSGRRLLKKAAGGIEVKKAFGGEGAFLGRRVIVKKGGEKEKRTGKQKKGNAEDLQKISAN